MRTPSQVRNKNNICFFGLTLLDQVSACISACEEKGFNSDRLVSCITTLHLFSKIRAQLMVKHAMTMQPYLTTKCNVSAAEITGISDRCSTESDWNALSLMLH